MECAIQYLGVQVSNWVFTPESQDQGQNQVFALCEGLIFALEVECLAAVTSVKDKEPRRRSCQSNRRLRGSFGSWLADPSWVRPVGMTLVKEGLTAANGPFTQHASCIRNPARPWNHVSCLYPPACAEVMQSSYAHTHTRARALSDMLFILYYMCEWWNSSSIFTSSCLFLSPSYILLISKPPEKTFPSFNANFWSRRRLFLFFNFSNFPEILFTLQIPPHHPPLALQHSSS